MLTVTRDSSMSRLAIVFFGNNLHLTKIVKAIAGMKRTGAGKKKREIAVSLTAL